MASEHILDLFAAFALPCSPGGAACVISNAAAAAAGLGRDSPTTLHVGSSRSLYRHSPVPSQYAVPEDEIVGDGLTPRYSGPSPLVCNINMQGLTLTALHCN